MVKFKFALKICVCVYVRAHTSSFYIFLRSPWKVPENLILQLHRNHHEVIEKHPGWAMLPMAESVFSSFVVILQVILTKLQSQEKENLKSWGAQPYLALNRPSIKLILFIGRKT